MSFKPVSVSELLPLDKQASQLGITYVDSGKNFAVIEIILDDRHLNFMGRCHGGVVFSLADTAFGLASNMGGNLSLAIDAHITFIKGAGLPASLAAASTVLSGAENGITFTVATICLGTTVS